MRVAILSHLFPSWSNPQNGSFVAEQARALHERAEVSVVCGSYDGVDRTEHMDGLEVRYLRLPWARLTSKLSLLLATWVYIRKATAWLRSGARRPDVIHAHYGFPDGVVGCAVGRRLGIPVVVTLHGDDGNLQMTIPIVGKLIAKGLSSASSIICVSEALRSVVIRNHPSLAPLLVTLPNGYDSDDIRFEPHEEARYFLFVGALLPVKNPDVLVRAFARVAPRTDLDLAIAGTGPMEQSLASLAHELGLEDRVRLLGRLSHRDVGRALRRAKALVLPSRHEGMPIVVIEALASGTPVVASRVGGIPELVVDDSLGLLAEPNDVDALAEVLAAAAQRTWDEEHIAAHAPVLTWRENAAELVGLYDHALAGAVNQRAAEKRLVYLTLQATTEGQAAHAHVNGVVDGLRRRGWQVDLFKPEYQGDPPGVVGRLAEFWRVQRRLYEHLDGARAFYCRSHFAALPATLAACRRGVPTVQEVNGTWEDIYLAWPQARRIAPLLIGLVRAQWRRAAALVTVTSPLADWASGEADGVPARVIPNAADTRKFGPNGPEASGLPRPYVVFVGALAAWQGIPTLLDALRDDSWPSGLHLVVVGDGSERPAVEAAVQEGLPVVFLGTVGHREVPAILRGAVASISPQNSGHGRSDTGLSPVKVYESLACDVPVVVTDYPGQAELVRSTNCGVVVRPEDPHALAAGIAMLAGDPERAHHMGERGGSVVRRWHSWDARAAETDSLLRTISARTPAPVGSAVGARARFEQED